MEVDAVSPQPLTEEVLERCLTDSDLVALRWRQRLHSIESLPDGTEVVYPPTYADIGYSIDTLQDGRKVALIDSIGSQANRLERLFMPGGELASLVPQYTIKINNGSRVSIHELAHRAADATVMSTPELADLSQRAFREYADGDATTMCANFPTALLFGAWDSRGDTGVKLPRLVRAEIRAWDVEPLHAAAQFNSVWKRLDADQRNQLEAEAKKQKKELSEYGLKDSPAVFRSRRVKKYLDDGRLNQEARVLGGILVKGEILRHVAVNLIALRGHTTREVESTSQLQRYLLGLALLTVTAPVEMYLRQGALLHEGTQTPWELLSRDGSVAELDLSTSRDMLRTYTERAAAPFREHQEPRDEYEFDTNAAKRLLAKKVEEEGEE